MHEDLTLPGHPPRVLALAYNDLSDEARRALRPHLLGGTSSEYLADWLRRAGKPVGSRTIRRYRASIERSV